MLPKLYPSYFRNPEVAGPPPTSKKPVVTRKIVEMFIERQVIES